MSDTSIAVRSLHDLGLAAWFGGTLMGAIGLNEAAARSAGTDDAAKVSSVGWDAWTPVNLAAIGAHLIGDVAILVANKGRLATQKGVGAATVAKTGLTVAALAATAYSRVLGKKVSANSDEPAHSGTQPAAGTDPEVANAQRQLRLLQWAIPVLTGGVLVTNAWQGELQRPKEVASGMIGRLLGS